MDCSEKYFSLEGSLKSYIWAALAEKSISMECLKSNGEIDASGNRTSAHDTPPPPVWTPNKVRWKSRSVPGELAQMNTSN